MKETTTILGYKVFDDEFQLKNNDLVYIYCESHTTEFAINIIQRNIKAKGLLISAYKKVKNADAIVKQMNLNSDSFLRAFRKSVVNYNYFRWFSSSKLLQTITENKELYDFFIIDAKRVNIKVLKQIATTFNKPIFIVSTKKIEENTVDYSLELLINNEVLIDSDTQSPSTEKHFNFSVHNNEQHLISTSHNLFTLWFFSNVKSRFVD